jgi:hypothetical protein
MRGFRNAGREDAYLTAILGGTDTGRLTWPSEVLEKARQTGFRLDADSNVIKA